MDIATHVDSAKSYLAANQISVGSHQLAKDTDIPPALILDVIGELWCQRLIRPAPDQKWTNIDLQPQLAVSLAAMPQAAG